MNLNKIILFNYGPFYERNTIVLNSGQKKGDSTQRNIILIGGKNGSGKTSLFTALQICLYGQSALGYKASRRAYEDYLRGQVHRKSNGLFKIDTASIEIDFDFSICGNSDNYRVKRTWEAKSNGDLEENLIVMKNGKPLDSYEKHNWQDFVKYLVPQGLLKLFFFDGERIDALTRDNDNQELGSSIQTLFGMDLIKQLKADLRYFERKRVTGTGSDEIRNKLQKLDESIAQTILDIENCDSRIASLNQQRDIVCNSISASEERFRSVGGKFASSREIIRSDVRALETIVEERSRELRNLYQLEVPFVYSGKYVGKLADKIRRELELRKKIKYQEEFDKAWKASKKAIRAFVTSKKNLDGIYGLLTRHLDRQVDQLMFDELSDVNLNDILHWIEKDSPLQKKQAVQIAEEIERAQKEAHKLSARLEYIPEESDFSVHVEKINGLYKERGEIDAAISMQEAKRRELNSTLAGYEGERNRLEEELGEIAKGDRKLALVAKTLSVLDEFEVELLKSKISALEENILTSLNQLLRKTDVIKRIRINEEDFDVVLEDGEDRKLDKKQLSEGEKQIYAVSLLSGITKTTRRAFPVFFDTPLGRLDSDHRMNIIHNYFPIASHQLIILSTDTEIDRQYFEEIRPYLSCSYLLDFDMEKKSTNIVEGYFWK